MDNDRTERLVANAKALPRRISAIAMAIGGVLGTMWFQLSPEQQLALIKMSPLPLWLGPIALTLPGLISQIWPRKHKIAHDEAAPKPEFLVVEKDRSE